MRKTRRRGQAYILEFAIGVLAISFAIGAYYQFTPTTDNRGLLVDLNSEAKLMSDSLMSEGYPGGWTNDTVARLGVTDGRSRLNMTKVTLIGDMEYQRSRDLFGTAYEYIVFFQYRNGTVIEIPTINSTQIGKPGYDHLSVKSDQEITALVKTERLLIYQGDIVRMILYLWSG